MLLDIPDIRQATDDDCGAAALDAVARFHGLRERGPVKLANPVQGMSPDTVEALVRALGLPVVSGTMTVPDLAHFARAGRPTLTLIQTDDCGHWVAVRGVRRGRVHFHCPLYGPRSLREADWVAGWTDRHFLGGVYDRWGICPGKADG